MNRDRSPEKSGKTESSNRTKSGGTDCNCGGLSVRPVLQEVSRLAAGVAAVASGSATGNPRNKCALQPGHSLMDWIRLGSSGRDLTGVGDRAGKMTVSPKQLAEHCTAEDAWIAIRGKVFNVTAYLPFHPGGPEELLKGAGKDATKLFDEVHAWVNYESILQKCLIGRLTALEPGVDSSALFFGSNDKPLRNKRVAALADGNGSPRTALISQNNAIRSKASLKTDDVDLKTEIVPKFDWIQKTDWVTLIFYMKAYSNPLILVRFIDEENVIIELSEQNVYINEIKFTNTVQQPCKIKVNYETGKVEVFFRKKVSKIWDNYGALKQKIGNTSNTDVKIKYKVIRKVGVNHNTFLLEMKRSDAMLQTTPIGWHVRVYKSDTEIRSYTPVPSNLFETLQPTAYTTDSLCLMVKNYEQGVVSRFICNCKPEDEIEMSRPLGNFSLKAIENREAFLLVAAGTGITPMLSLLIFILERRTVRCQKVTLLFFNRKEEDILCRNQLDALQLNDKRLSVEHILSEADGSWTGRRGHASNAVLDWATAEQCKDTLLFPKDIYVTVCGPTAFTNLTKSLLQQTQFREDQIHCFLG